jgi:hypothetical protein
MWVRVDRESAKLGFLDDMAGSAATAGGGWLLREIVGRVDDNGRNIAVGFIARGAGTTLVDDISLEFFN